jgi:Domain of unknown function (DUF4278)
MQLSYRGTAYEAQNPAIEMSETGTDRLGLFLGRRFKMKQINVTQRYTPSKQLTYRGVHYEQ